MDALSSKFEADWIKNIEDTGDGIVHHIWQFLRIIMLIFNAVVRQYCRNTETKDQAQCISLCVI